MAKTQTPGFYRMMLGQFEVTALLDGCVELDASLLRNAPIPKSKPPDPPIHRQSPHQTPTSVNAYLINTGEKLILIDTGGGNLCGPAMGNLPRSLKAAGYQSEAGRCRPADPSPSRPRGGHCGPRGQAGLCQGHDLRLEARERLLAFHG